MEEADVIAEKLRQEPFHMFWNNCLSKSFKFRKECRKAGINARVIFAFVLTPCRRFPLPPYIIWFHAWAEVNGKRIELARPLNEKNSANTFDIDIIPIIMVRI